MRRVPSYIGPRRMIAERVDRLAAGIDVLGDAQRADQAALLVDHGDAGIGGALLVEAGDRHAVELDRAAVGLIDAGDEVHERRLAGAVLADQRVHLAAPHLERDVVDRTDAREGLDDVADRRAAAAVVTAAVPVSRPSARSLGPSAPAGVIRRSALALASRSDTR